MKLNYLILTLLSLLVGPQISGKPNREIVIGKPLPLWSDGYMDIYAINSGRGECSFIIFPDGTTMLVDAGEFLTRPESQSNHQLVEQRPNACTRPYMTYAKFIRHFMKSVKGKTIDYAILTHFHMDHLGSRDKNFSRSKEGYLLTGVMALYSEIPFTTMVDRAYPDYESMKRQDTSTTIDEYQKFILSAMKNDRMKVERFHLGSDSQFVQKKKPLNYPNFKISNLTANGKVWLNGEAYDCYKGSVPRENDSSAGVLISYGNFNYWTGGDGSNKNLEIPLAKAIGHPIEAMKSNHHLSWRTMNPEMLKILRPQVIVSQSFYSHQPDIPTLKTLLDQNTYSGEKKVYMTNMVDSVRYAPENNEVISQLAGIGGHVVIRVLPDGNSFYVIMLEDKDFKYRVKQIEGPFICN